MKVYNYNSHTGVFRFEEDADPDPLVSGRWLLPAYATFIKPPELADDQVAQFDEEKQVWTVIDIQEPVVPYHILRAREYPSIIDYIDGVVKNDQEQIDKYIKLCKAVKAKYPKPDITNDDEI